MPLSAKPSLDTLLIKGGKALEGTIVAAGAKNAMTKLLVASLLSDKKCIFHNVPNIGDVEITVELCKEIGSEIIWEKEKKILEITTKKIKSTYVSQRFSGANRIPILLIGALLGRTQEDIIVPTVGGDKLGNRPLNFHVDALTQLGAFVEYREMKNEGAYFAQAHQGLKAACITLPYPSVGATENALLAAIRAKGTTEIKNIAIEPEVMDLILFLQKLGAEIAFTKDRSLLVHESSNFKEVEHHVITDRNEVASYAIAAISTQGRIFIEKAQHEHMLSFLYHLQRIGAGFEIKENGIEFFYVSKLKGGVFIETNVHPGFMTDWQQPFGVLLSQCEGISMIHETVYENRFGYVNTLIDMGANAQLFTQCLGNSPCRYSLHKHKHSLIIQGKTPLTPQHITIPDLRAGFAYIIAALLANGKSQIEGAHFLDRGYENFIEKLQGLGADIERIKNEPEPTPLKDLLRKKVPN